MASMDGLNVIDDLERKRLALRGELEATGGLMVAFSGGVDSSLLLAAAVEALGPRAVAATGVYDLGDWRPGQRAAAERGVRTPLVAAGFTKRDVREASRRMGLRTHDKPAAACLASRVAYGIQVTPARLSRVERAEALVRSFGLAQLRVRDHGDLARVEVPVDALPLLVRADTRERLVEGLRELGFAYVTVDLEGFRSGSMNAGVLP